jgi:phenylacetate-CoA ligase
MAMKTYTLGELVETARRGSPFYADLYRNVPVAGWTMEELPIIDQKAFWDANTSANNRLLTGPMNDGIVFKSGGTTGNPKFSVFTPREWQSFTELFGQGLAANGLKSGERIANIFYAGELYASFLFITFSVYHSPAGALQFPIAGATNVADIVHLIREYDIDVIAGVPTSLLGIGEYLASHESAPPAIRKILFGGESMYPDQRAFLQRVIPGVKIASIGYASVDAGHLGFADEGCAYDEHRVFGEASILEIIDEDTGEVIHEAGRPGKVLITNLTRLLMPIVRYPAGDRAMWVEPETSPNRKFVLMGRSEESARIGPMTLYVKDIRDILSPFWENLGIVNFQMAIEHRDKKDSLVLRIVSSLQKGPLQASSQGIVAEISRQRPMYRELLAGDKINPVAVEWIDEKELIINPRTGKLRMVVDNRMQYRGKSTTG